MTTAQMREAIRAAPYKQTDGSAVFALDEIGGLYEVSDAIVCRNGSIVFILEIRYDKETVGRELIVAALAERNGPEQD